MSTYIISDTHFNHDAIIEYSGRPKNHEELLYNNLVNHLTKDDTLIHLGDICIKRDIYVHEKYIQPLPCTKILVRGNHDKKSNTRYLNHGRDFVCHSIEDDLFGYQIRFTHQPSTQNPDILNIHGHWHEKKHLSEGVPNYNGLLYSPELYDYKPIKLDRFLRMNKKI